MRNYETAHPIKEITIDLGGDLQDIDIGWLSNALLEGLTAKNYLKLYRRMQTEIKKDFEDIVIIPD